MRTETKKIGVFSRRKSERIVSTIRELFCEEKTPGFFVEFHNLSELFGLVFEDGNLFGWIASAGSGERPRLLMRIFSLGCVLFLAACVSCLAAFRSARYPRLHGDYSLLGALHSTEGSAGKTGIRKGEFLTNELKLGIEQPLARKWQSAARFHVRKTGDPQIDAKQEVHLLGYTVEIFNPDFRLTGGELYADISQYTMVQSLEGVQIAATRGASEFKIAGGLAQREEDARRFRRWVLGGESGLMLIKDFGFVKDWKMGFNFAVEQSSNLVVGMNSQILLWNKTNLEAEFAKSWVEYDKEESLGGGRFNRGSGHALSLKTMTQVTRKTKFQLDYEWVSPDFKSLSGSAVPDRVTGGSRFEYKWSKEWSSIASYRVSYDKLDRSSLTKRTFTQAPRLTLDWRPESGNWVFKDFSSRVYWEMRRRTSQDNPSSQVDFRSQESGAEFEFKLKGIAINSGGSVRSENDHLQSANDRILYTGFIGMHRRGKIFGYEALPLIRWQFTYDQPKEGGRNLAEGIQGGLNLKLSRSLNLDQKVSVETASRSAPNSDATRWSATFGLEYKIKGNENAVFKLNFNHVDYIHASPSETFAHDNLQTQLVLKF